MKRQVLEDLLTRHVGGSRSGDAVAVGAGVEVSLYIAMGVEPLVVDRVTSVALEEETVVAITRREERYICAYEDLRAVRVSPTGRGAGY